MSSGPPEDARADLPQSRPGTCGEELAARSRID